ncbi:HPF/RaiA family ribosome-associated protein [Coxiella endosymbiont of Ornithodoros maritimus]|uniref:HPF/RaiA family ribosome-associated protein n=1 Tax=Coxiella endosymbiont of Ornithodoros maritimus TaxID=1656172 RepID=UPI0022654B69|nr:HPF/RaiA family ribosome-associated protein [Coxiella endosymbiont of Ornithodoros maritimus]
MIDLLFNNNQSIKRTLCELYLWYKHFVVNKESFIQVPLQITLRNINPTPAIEDRIHKKADKLSQYSDQIISCHIVVELPKRHQHQGKLYNVWINLTLPGKEFAVNRDEVEDLYVAIRDAFDDMARKVEEEMRMRMGHVKAHPELLHGEIVRLFKEKILGLLQRQTGRNFTLMRGTLFTQPLKN